MRLYFILLSLALFSCSEKKVPLYFSGITMGTTFSVKYYPAPNTPDKNAIRNEVSVLLEEINKKFSTYIKDSEISRFNRYSAGKWFTASPEFFALTDKSLYIARLTRGAFDPTLGPLVNLWGFGPDGNKKVPSKNEVMKVRKRVGYRKMRIKKEGLKIKKIAPQMYLDLSALAKGYGVDAVGDLLERVFVTNYMVEIGGEVKTKGTRGDVFWRIGIEVPSNDTADRKIKKIVNLKDMSLATSGNYRNFFKKGGRSFHHIISAKTGVPVQSKLASVTVAMPSCADADAYATALMAMGLTRGLAFAKRQNMSAYFIYKDGSDFKTKSTASFERLLKRP